MTSVDSNFWLERWQRGETGWHLPRVHPKLINHWSALNVPADASVFVPLCGKTLDMVWLAQQQCHVYACEISEFAVQQFFSDLEVTPEVKKNGQFDLYHYQNITIYVGDFFAMTPSCLPAVSFIYDRAALVALPPALRSQYAQHLQQLLPTAAMLLITLNYDQSLMSGPPFAVACSDVTSLFSAQTHIDALEDHEIISHEPRFSAKGLLSLREQVYSLKWSHA